ncbi:MAG: hypothetical protein U0270_18365 [Labilithrix sp.]
MGLFACVSAFEAEEDGAGQGATSVSADISAPASASAILASDQHRPVDLVVDATHVYWTTYAPSGDRAPFDRRHDVLRVAKSGGPIETLAKDQKDLVGLTLDASHVYWLARTGECTAGAPTGVARRAPKAGGAAESIANRLPCGSPSANTQAVVDGTHLYWSGDDGIRAVAKTGGTPALVASAGPNPNASTRSTVLLLQDETTVYWGDSYGPLWAQPKAGGEKVKLLDSSPWHAAVDATAIYYAANGKVMSVAKTGGAPRELGPSGGRGEEAFAVDAGYVYWTDIVDSQIRRLPKRGDVSAETLVAGERAFGLSVDATGMYYPAYGREIGGMIPDYIAKSGYIRRRP